MSRGLPVLIEFKVATKQGRIENIVHPKQYRRPTLTQHEVHSHAAGFMPEILTFRSRVRERSPGLKPNGTHFEPQRASVRAGRTGISCKSGPHATALRLKIYKVSAIWPEASSVRVLH